MSYMSAQLFRRTGSGKRQIIPLATAHQLQAAEGPNRTFQLPPEEVDQKAIENFLAANRPDHVKPGEVPDDHGCIYVN